jgi:hypothetical protein
VQRAIHGGWLGKKLPSQRPSWHVDRLAARIDARLRLGGGFLDAQLGDSGFDGFRHADMLLT